MAHLTGLGRRSGTGQVAHAGRDADRTGGA
jgi:hypothetical protein